MIENCKKCKSEWLARTKTNDRVVGSRDGCHNCHNHKHCAIPLTSIYCPSIVQHPLTTQIFSPDNWYERFVKCCSVAIWANICIASKKSPQFVDNRYVPTYMQVWSYHTFTQMCSADNWYVPTYVQVLSHYTFTQMCSPDNRHVRAPSYTYYSEAIAQTSFPEPFGIHVRFPQHINPCLILRRSWLYIVQCTKLKRSANLLLVNSIILFMPHFG